MKSASAPLIALLNTDTQFLMADLLTITLITGTVLRYANSDVDIVYSGNTFNSRDVKFKRGRTRVVVGIEVDTLDLEFYADSSNLVSGVAFLPQALAGGFDGAYVKLERAFLSAWATTPVGAIILFTGRVASMQASRTVAKMSVKSDLELLNIKMPRNLYQPGCIHSLYDAGCKLVKASWAVSGTTGSSSTKSVVNCNLAQASGYFDLGTVQLTSGANNGLIRTVKSYTVGVLNFALPLTAAPISGDTFTAHPGCDKKQSTCTAKFNNLLNFRGFPYVPTPEVAH